MSRNLVCSTKYLYHHLINPKFDDIESFVSSGIRPLSDFPESDRWKQLEEHMPGFYENLFSMIAQPLLLKNYPNSGIFVTPIDFRKLPGTYLYEKPRFVIPIDRLDPEWSVLTYVIDDERTSLPFNTESLKTVAEYWDEEMVRKWFAVDPTKIFFYVPQVAAYQGVINVSLSDYEES